MHLPRLLLLSALAVPGPLAAQPATAPPPPAVPTPAVPVALPPVAPLLTTPDPRLEAALRARLFAGPVAARPVAKGDPDTTEWEQARATGKHPPCAEVGPLRYVHNRLDLDGDGTPEQLALVVGSYACGSGGCTLMIFRRTGAGLEPVSELGVFQSPLRVLPQRHGGWLDLRMPGSVDGVVSGTVDLRHDGSIYRPVSVPVEPVATGPVVLEMPSVPFENLGLPLACAP